METIDNQIARILDDVQRACMAEDSLERKGFLQRIELACKALIGQERAADMGPWKISENGRWISSDNFDNDVMLEIKVTGDFWGDIDRLAYSKALAAKLNDAKELPTGLPKEPPAGLLRSMALRYRHDFGLDADDSSPMSGGLTDAERQALLTTMHQLYEEVSGHGFFKWPE